MQHTVLATFLVIQHELHGNAGLARPLRMGRLGAIANEVARVGLGTVVMAHAVIITTGEWYKQFSRDPAVQGGATVNQEMPWA